MAIIHGKTVTLHLRKAELPPFPGTVEEGDRILPLLQAVYEGRYEMTTEYDGTDRDYPFVHPVVNWFVRCVITDRVGTELADLTEAQAEWAARWFYEQKFPRWDVTQQEDAGVEQTP